MACQYAGIPEPACIRCGLVSWKCVVDNRQPEWSTVSLWVPLTIAALLSIGGLVRGAWPLVAAGWTFFGIGALIGGDLGPIVITFGAVLLLLGGASMTRGAIFDGSPKAELSERKPSIFGENYDIEVDVDSVHFTHRFWGP